MHKQNYFKFFIIVLCILVLCGFIVTKLNQDSTTVKINNIILKVRIADSVAERGKGLMGLENLPEGTGMIFIFETKGYHYFWMKNTKIPLDIIWINEESEIVDIVTAPPCSKDPCPLYKPSAKALYAIETNANWALNNGIKVGSKVELIQKLMDNLNP